MKHSLKSWFLRGGLFAFVFSLLATAVSAETLLMPKRDGLAGTPIIVWGTTTLANGTAFTLDFGDASSTSGTVGDRSYINFSHNYAAAGNYDVTLTVGAESATVKVQIFNPAAVTADQLRGLKINMAIEDGLRYFWQAQANRAANFPANVLTDWGGDITADTALIVLAFENHGYTLSGNVAPTGVYEKYIVRRGLNRIMGSLATINLSVQAAGNPCVGAGADCVGLTATSDPGYATAVAMLPFAASGALTRVNTEVAGYTANKTYGEILQRLVNAEAFGQSDANCGAGRGGFGYSHNGCQFDGSTVGWSILGFLDAEAAGAVVPAFVRTEFAFGFNNALNTDGSFDYSADGSPNSVSSPGPQKTGIGLQGLFFLSDTGARVNLVSTNISSWWNGGPGIGQNPWGCGVSSSPNKGCAYSMFNNFKGLKLNGVTTLPGVTRPAGPGTQPAGDWYADYQDWLVNNQTSPNAANGGYWGTMGFSCCNHRSNFTNLNAAIAELILSPVALVLPDEEKFGQFGLSPATNTLLELGTHTVTAKAESTGGTPVPGATVNFLILSGPNAGLTGTDTTDTNGEAHFTYTDGGPLGTVGTDKIQASIGALDSNIVDMIWIPQNTPPTATNNSYSTNEDAVLTGNAVTDAPADSDPDAGDVLTATLLIGTTNGAVVLNADGSFTYTPNADYCGADSFTYKVNDGTVDSNVATVNIDVVCVNDPPVANPDAKVTPEETPVSGTVTSSDVDGGAPSYSLATAPANGAAVVNPDGTYTYTPALNFTGTDSFTYTVSDGNGGTDTETVTIDVTPVNDPPVADPDAKVTPEETPVSGNLTSSDVDGGAPTYSLATAPTHGTVVVNADGSYTYTPALNYNGPDSFTYTVDDGNGGTDTETVTIDVTPVNDPPVANPDAKVTPEETPVSGALTSSDVDGGAPTYSLATAPTHGTVAVNADGTYTYTPEPEYNGPDSFTYTVDDGNGGTATATVTIDVTPVNDPPVANPDVKVTPEDTPVGGLLTSSDLDGGSPVYSLATGALHGTVVVNANGTYTYTPAGNYSGPDFFTYTVVDGNGGTDTETVTIQVTPVNDPPVANPGSKTTPEDTPVSGLLTSSDNDGGAPVYSLATGTTHGTVVVNADGSYTYTPAPNYNGPDSFTFMVVDGNGGSATSTVTLTVTPVNDKPVAVDDSYTGQWNTLLTVAAPGVLTNDSDVDGNTLTAIKLTNPGSGTLVFSANGSLTFMPTANWSGTVSFTYKANDGSLDSNVATVKIRITSPCGNGDHRSRDGRSNDGRSDDGRSDDRSGKSGKSRDGRSGDGRSRDGRSDDHSSDDHSNDSGCKPGTPIAHKDHYTTKKNTSLTVLPNKGVLKNDNAFSVNAQLFAAPTRGTVVLAANGSFLYTPMPGFVGDDFFTYVPRSASGVAGNVVKVTVRVRGHWDGDNCDHDKKKNKHKKGDKCDHDKDHD